MYIHTCIATSVRINNVILAYETCFLNFAVNKGDNCRQIIKAQNYMDNS